MLRASKGKPIIGSRESLWDPRKEFGSTPKADTGYIHCEHIVSNSWILYKEALMRDHIFYSQTALNSKVPVIDLWGVRCFECNVHVHCWIVGGWYLQTLAVYQKVKLRKYKFMLHLLTWMILFVNLFYETILVCVQMTSYLTFGLCTW